MNSYQFRLFSGDIMGSEYDSAYIKKIVCWLEEQENRVQKGINLWSNK
jgi:hypothetical protein